MKKIIILVGLFTASVYGMPKTDWQMEREMLEQQFIITQASADRIDVLRGMETVSECILRLALNGYPKVYEMIEEAQSQYGSSVFFELFGKEMGFVNAFDAEAKIKMRYPAWAQARGLNLTTKE